MKRPIPLVLAALGIFAIGVAGLALGGDDDHHEHDERRSHEYRSNSWVEPGEDVAPVTNASYTEECGACHMAYQPGLLPADAWRRIMQPDALAAHYGDDASLEPALRQDLTAYLTGHGAEQARSSRSRAFAVGKADVNGLPRITATRYFRNEHHEIPARMVADNAEVGGFSNCNACHTSADAGIYNEHRVQIPGHGRWDD
jgi:hypothetical protein